MELNVLEPNMSIHVRAEQIVFRDLINALLQENLAGFVDRAQIGADYYGPTPHECTLEEGEQYFRLAVDTDRFILFRIKRQAFIQPYKISRLPVYLVKNEEVHELDPLTFMQALAEAIPAVERASAMPNLLDFLGELRDSISHTALSLKVMTEQQWDGDDGFASLLQVERFSALRDRPFHPTSRAKRGWSETDYQRYSPEFGETFGLDWIAVRKDHIQTSSPFEIVDFILAESEKEELRIAAQLAGILQEEYLLFPVHPWQMEHIIPSVFQYELKQRICVPVRRGLGQFRSTSSVRAMTASAVQNCHVKVPIGIFSLGALRLLPPRYLHNGAKGQTLLNQAMEKDEWLRAHLRLCDETKWWGYHDPQSDPFDDKPGHLACLIREYPADLVGDPEWALIPMSALAVADSNQKNPVIAAWLRKRAGNSHGKCDALALFREICRVFVGVSLKLFQYGIMPEIHGQNVLLILRNQQVCGLLLRDHDTIRLHLPWLEKSGLKDPDYLVKPGTPNSLINETPQQLLSYFQTLGVQVNLYAIADALNTAYSIPETAFWSEMRSVVRETLREFEFASAVREVLEAELLDGEKWPIRLLLTPLLKRAGSGGGSMPAGAGSTGNPFRTAEDHDG